ncbi:nucleotidyltransferase domain-containing protein [Christensenella intestinihominis]|uniref:nucleotidyltransferase domain-containing protein n=1 Tax=Christensenella intestinihominis TaxID=1851429 RepID=UPI00082DF7C3|nr:nucleotidyltransferase domain-containing protein [Christensenella intestinihominis]
MTEHLIERIAEELAVLPSVKGIVLGGSRATGIAGPESDIDIGIYYDENGPDLEALNRAAQRLDDEHRAGLICREGAWGNWVNCGGWLVVGGTPTDLILRDIMRVRKCIGECEQGKVSPHYQAGHPHAYLNVMYRGELATCRVLYSRDNDFMELKKWAGTYPDRLRDALMDSFLAEARFSCALAKDHLQGNDLYYVAGHLFRAVSALNQVLFAYNREYCLNEKKAVLRVAALPVRPEGYEKRVNRVFSLLGGSAKESCIGMEKLIAEAAGLCGK